MEVGRVRGHLASGSLRFSSDIRGFQTVLVLLQVWEWSLRVTRKGKDTEPVTHVPAEQIVHDCEEAGL